MATWQNQHNPEEIITGDKPYGEYWNKIPDKPLVMEDVTKMTTTTDQLAAIKKAILTGDKTDLIAINTKLK